jgi:hypothetical protein
VLSFEEAHRLWFYDEETGIFTWKTPPIATVKVGDRADHPWGVRARRVMSKGKKYFAHRVAWLMVHGEWPNAPIDHIDCNASNNALNNLRLCTPAQNSWNRAASANNKTSGRKGVCYDRFSNRWAAYMNAHGKRVLKRSFKTREEAEAAHAEAARKHHGQFARF